MSEQQSVEQRVISDLFSRIQQAEAGSGPRDAEAERLIQECIAKQPSAPYYMAQAMLVQEAAIKRLNDQVNALQQQVTQLQSQPRQSSGGFLAGMFRNSQPEEIVNVVEDNNMVQPDSAQPDLTQADNAQPDNTQPDLQNADWQDDTSNQNGQDSGFFDSGLGSDDDSDNNNDDDSFF